jgi:hypothetical protein
LNKVHYPHISARQVEKRQKFFILSSDVHQVSAKKQSKTYRKAFQGIRNGTRKKIECHAEKK